MPVRRSARLSARGRAECPPPEGPDSEPNHQSIKALRSLFHTREGILLMRPKGAPLMPTAASPGRCVRQQYASAFWAAERKKARGAFAPRALEVKPDNDLLSHGETPHYHRRRAVSLLSSGWDQVVPTRYDRQANCDRFGSWRQSGSQIDEAKLCAGGSHRRNRHQPQSARTRLYGQAARAISTG